MKLQPLAILPFAAAVIAVVASAALGSIYVLAVAIPSVLLGIAVIYLYSKPPEATPKGIQLENFSIWADIGEPGAELRRLEPNDMWSAVRVMKADLNTLSANAALLDRRILMLIGRENFDGLAKYDLQGDARKVARKTADLGNKMETDGKFPAETIPTMEQSAALLDRVANKLFEFEHGKPETVHIYVDPLKRAAEKLSKDIRQTTSNITAFSKGAGKGAPAPEKSAPAAPQEPPKSPEQPPKSSEQGTSSSGQAAPGTSG